MKIIPNNVCSHLIYGCLSMAQAQQFQMIAYLFNQNVVLCDYLTGIIIVLINIAWILIVKMFKSIVLLVDLFMRHQSTPHEDNLKKKNNNKKTTSTDMQSEIERGEFI